MRRLASSCSFALVLGLGLVACSGGGGNGGDDGSGHGSGHGSGSGSDDPDGGTGSDVDAFVGDQSCGAAIQTTASPDYQIGGLINDNDPGFGTTGTSNLIGATVTAFHNPSTSLGSDSESPWGIEITDSKTTDYVSMSADGYQSVRFYPKAPAATTVTFLTVPMLVNDNSGDDEFHGLASTYGVTQDAGKGIVAVYIFDCQGDRITGATATSSGGGTVKYVGNGSSTNASGVSLIFNVPAGQTTLNAAGGGAPEYHPITVAASPDYITIAVVAPKAFD